MSAILLDDQLRAKLGPLTSTVPVRDEAGRTVGYFVPEKEYLAEMYEWAHREFGTPEAEERTRQAWQEYRAGKKGRTTAEVLERLKKLHGGAP